MSERKGRAWVFGDDISTDALAPGPYLKLPVEEFSRHCLESADPEFAANVKPGDMVVAGRNFGQGSSREQAAEALKHLGIAAVVARSFGGIFYRNAFNFGLPALVCDDTAEIRAGDRMSLDLDGARLVNLDLDRSFAIEPVPDHLLALIRAGGLVAQLAERGAAR